MIERILLSCLVILGVVCGAVKDGSRRREQRRLRIDDTDFSVASSRYRPLSEFLRIWRLI